MGRDKEVNVNAKSKTNVNYALQKGDLKMKEKNHKDRVIEKLKSYRREDIIITDHAKIQAEIRGIDLEEVMNNIANPKRLAFAEKQPARSPTEEKYNCYFGYSKTQAHRYILVLGNKVIIPTVIKINRRWQSRVEKHGKI